MSERHTPLLVLLVVLMAAVLTPAVASATVEPGFRACGHTATAVGPAKVAVHRTRCVVGRRVARGYYAKARTGSYDGKLRDGSIFYAVHGFICTTGLGGSQAFCRLDRARVDMSARPGDTFPF